MHAAEGGQAQKVNLYLKAALCLPGLRSRAARQTLLLQKPGAELLLNCFYGTFGAVRNPRALVHLETIPEQKITADQGPPSEEGRGLPNFAAAFLAVCNPPTPALHPDEQDVAAPSRTARADISLSGGAPGAPAGSYPVHRIPPARG